MIYETVNEFSDTNREMRIEVLEGGLLNFWKKFFIKYLHVNSTHAVGELTWEVQLHSVARE
jgi:hypothetical protein